MKKSSMILAAGLIFLATALLTAHPHLRKSVTAQVGSGVDVTVSYFTAPSNEEHAKNAAVGAFTPSFARLKLAGALTIDGNELAAGEYTVGAIKNSDDDWTLALYPGQIPRGESADMSKVVKLPSAFDRDHGNAEHLHFDILPGSGAMAGKTVLIWHFGSLYLQGALT